MCRLMYVNDVLDFLLLVISNCSSMHFLKLPVHLYWTTAVLDISVVHYVSHLVFVQFVKNVVSSSLLLMHTSNLFARTTILLLYLYFRKHR
jgi:hypothetical protein